jgi:hypothetical protein
MRGDRREEIKFLLTISHLKPSTEKLIPNTKHPKTELTEVGSVKGSKGKNRGETPL